MSTIRSSGLSLKLRSITVSRFESLGPVAQPAQCPWPHTLTPNMRPGDIIVSVDGKSADGLDTTAVANMLKGPKGTHVHLTVSREGAGRSAHI